MALLSGLAREKAFKELAKYYDDRKTSNAVSEIRFASSAFQNEMPEWTAEDFLKSLDESFEKYREAMRRDFNEVEASYDRVRKIIKKEDKKK